MPKEVTFKPPPPSYKAPPGSSEGTVYKTPPVNGHKEPPQAHAYASYAAGNAIAGEQVPDRSFKIRHNRIYNKIAS